MITAVHSIKAAVGVNDLVLRRKDTIITTDTCWRGRRTFGRSLYSNLSQLSSVRSGTYVRALKAYYGRKNQTAPTQKNTAVNQNNYSAYSRQSGLSDVSKVSADLSAAAAKLTDSGKDGLFASRDNYDIDAAYKAAGDFVMNYNGTLDAVSKTANTVVNSAAGSMIRMSGVMSKSLGEIGITVSREGRMSLNEEEFRNAGFDKVKSMLDTNGSFAGIIDSSAQRLNVAAEQQSRQMSLNNTGLYGKYGSYFGNYGFGGSSFDGWI